MVVLNRQEKEKLVLDLYYNQAKNYRQIAKEARISPRDIGTILNKAIEGGKKDDNNDNNENQQQKQEQKQQQHLSLSTQAYKLFSGGKTPIEVAVALNVRESEVTRLYKEYWRLNHMHDLTIVYQELKGNIIPFIKLYGSVKAAGMSEQHVINVLKIADNNNLTALQYRYERLKKEVDSLECRKSNSKSTLQALTKTIDSCRLQHKEQIEKITDLHNKKIALENLVRRFENNNEEYLKIKQTVKENVHSTLSDAKIPLRFALLSIIESIRNNPEKYALIYCNNMYGQRQQQYASLQNYYNEYHTAMLLNEAEKLYNKLITDLTNSGIDDAAFNRSSSSSSPSSLLSQSANGQQQKS